MTLAVPPGPEPLNPTPRPLPDVSGGFVEILVARGVEGHTMRFHLLPFTLFPRITNSFTVPGALFTSTTVLTIDDLAYVADPASTNGTQLIENTVGVTIYNLTTLISRFYSNEWQIAPVALYATVPDPLYNDAQPTKAHPYAHTLLRMDPVPAVLTPIETGRNGTTSGAPASMINMHMKTPAVISGTPPVVTVQPGKMRVSLLDSAEWDHSGKPSRIAGGFESGTDDLEQFLGYLACTPDNPAATAVVAHNGQRVGAGAKIVNRFYQRSMRELIRALH